MSTAWKTQNFDRDIELMILIAQGVNPRKVAEKYNISYPRIGQLVKIMCRILTKKTKNDNFLKWTTPTLVRKYGEYFVPALNNLKEVSRG